MRHTSKKTIMPKDLISALEPLCKPRTPRTSRHRVREHAEKAEKQENERMPHEVFFNLRNHTNFTKKRRNPKNPKIGTDPEKKHQEYQRKCKTRVVQV